jgi:hypothetical protein
MIGCGGGSNGGGPKQDITVSLSPKTISVAGDSDQQFMATILNPNNTGVTWTVSGSACTGSACGTLSNYGGNNNQGWTATYTAPLTVPNPPTVTVTATSKDDPTKSDTATITITAPVVTVTVTPATPTVILGATQQLTANVRGTTNKAVTWTTSGPRTIDSNGLYSTPATLNTPKTVTVTATSQADTTKSGSATIAIPAVTVSVSPLTANVNGGEAQQFSATVTNATNQAVTWSLSGLGTVDTNGVYTAPTVIASQQTATVTATSVADPTKHEAATITLIPISVSVSPPTATVPLNATQQFTATVSGTSNNLVNWSVSGAGCTGNGCGTISASGLYTAPGTIPTPPTVTVTATSAPDMTKSGTSTVTLSTNANAKLNGPYAFYFRGFYNSGMTAMIGSFTADGSGNLTNGLRDVNSVSGSPVKQQAFTGTYQLHSDNRGILTFTSLTGSPSFRFSLNGSGDKGYMVEIDSTGTNGGGVLRKQTPGDFQLAKITGDYAFGFQGNGLNSERNTAVGRFHANGAGVLSGGELASSSPGTASFTGTATLNGTTGAANGRGTMTVVISGQGTFNAGIFMVNANEFFFLMEDQIGLDVPLINGTVLRQTGVPFAITALNGACTFYWNGLSQGSGATVALIGQLTANGSSSLSGEYASTDGGVATQQQTFSTTNLSIATNGRGLFDSSILGHVVFYLVDQNKAFLLHGDAAGMLEPQILPIGGLKISDLNGQYSVSTAEIVVSNTGAFSGTMNTDGTGNWTGTVDISISGGGVTDQPNAGQLTLTSATTGRIVNTTSVPSSCCHHVLYAVTPDRLLVVDSDDSFANQGVLWQTTGFWEK